MVTAETNPAIASGGMLLIIIALAAAAAMGFALGMAISPGRSKISVGTVCALIALGAAGYGLYVLGVWS